ncbi:hypothetical protein Tsp_07251 [Trichinella spiralis]|uniref:hypothetical protein n=1 Tax=Trichinella spiralis TaxID=6334 RepID=UPI0001EFC326|nr:hypothetical protein Tsp_07251 [Trichinella spiralis]
MVAIVLSAGRLEVVAGITLATTRRCGQSRRKWPCSPHQKHSVALRAGRLLFDLSSVVCSWSNRQVRASTAWTRLPFPASAFSVVRCRLHSTSVSSSAAFSASWRAFTSVVGSRRRSSLWTSFDATPQMKRATSSFSDILARRPNSATSWANSRIDWFFRCFRTLNRTASCIRDSPWPSSQEMSRGDPGGNNSLRTALYTHSLALAACCEDGTPVTTKKSSIDWSHSMGSIPGENVRGGP